MATSHRYPYCPKIVKLVHVKSPNVQKLKFCVHLLKCLSAPGQSTSEKGHFSLCPLPSHDHAYWHHSVCFLLSLGVYWMSAPPLESGLHERDSRGCFMASCPPPKTVSGTQKVFKQCWLNKWKSDSTVPPISFFHVWSKNTNLSSYYKNVNS